MQRKSSSTIDLSGIRARAHCEPCDSKTVFLPKKLSDVSGQKTYVPKGIFAREIGIAGPLTQARVVVAPALLPAAPRIVSAHLADR
jgi:hypothetical protein